MLLFSGGGRMFVFRSCTNILTWPCWRDEHEHACPFAVSTRVRPGAGEHESGPQADSGQRAYRGHRHRGRCGRGHHGDETRGLTDTDDSARGRPSRSAIRPGTDQPPKPVSYASVKSISTFGGPGSTVLIVHLPGDRMLTDRIADVARSVRAFSGPTRASSGNQGKVDRRSRERTQCLNLRMR